MELEKSPKNLGKSWNLEKTILEKSWSFVSDWERNAMLIPHVKLGHYEPPGRSSPLYAIVCFKFYSTTHVFFFHIF